MTNASRRNFGKWMLRGAVGAAAATALPRWASGQSGLKELVIAEPLHGIGYLPMYVSAANGYFAQEKIAIKILTIESGSGHTNAVLTKQAFAFIGGPEHNAFAKAKGAELRAVVNVVNRGNVYLVTHKGAAPKNRDYASYMKGKRIATGLYSGTPNSIMRYLLGQWGLDIRRDVQLMEVTSAASLAAMKTRNADVAMVSEPLLTRGIREGIWEEPFYNVPRELGDYAYSTLNIRKESIDTEPAVVAGFVRAIVKGLKFTQENPRLAAEVAKKEFPTMALEDLQATIDRAFADNLWSPDGKISQSAWTTGSKVVRSADLLKTDVAYGEIIDMRFV
jgi:NitT/TauT family transport system substrate-binding protein